MSTPATFTYDAIHHIDLDVWLDPISTGSLPTLIVFHGGGMSAGGKSDVFLPRWLLDKVTGTIVISANYRLLFPSSPSDQIEDVQTLFNYLTGANDFSAHLGQRSITLDPSRIVVLGISGGNYPARAAATLDSISPRPIGWISMYGMANDFLIDHWVQPKAEGYPMLAVEQEKLDKLLNTHGGPVSSDASLVPIPHLRKMGDEDNRVGLFSYMFRTGTLLDYVLSEPGLSEIIRRLPYEDRLAEIPVCKRHLLLPLTTSTPPALLLHGTKDHVVAFEESRRAYDDLGRQGLSRIAEWVEGADHGLMDPSNPPNRISGWEESVDRVMEWMKNLTARREMQ